MRFRAVATITWDFDTLTASEAKELANKQLGEFPGPQGANDARLVIRLDQLKEKIEKVNLGEFKIEEVMPFVSKDNGKRMDSHRYFIFRECMFCVACGLKGTRIFLECHPADKSPHFNLYGEEDGKLVLMTKDHIHAKSCGGKDLHSNYQTMCLTCNNLKSHSNLALDDLRELRRIFDENKNKLTKKKLHLLIEETRVRLAKPWPTKKKSTIKSTPDAVIAAFDINLYLGDNEIFGKSVYDTIVGNKHIGCIKRGTLLEPLVETKDKVMCKLSDNEVVVLHSGLLKGKELD
jgi:5-methylcytosine-specific restriction endonuclease McrA